MFCFYWVVIWFLFSLTIFTLEFAAVNFQSQKLSIFHLLLVQSAYCPVLLTSRWWKVKQGYQNSTFLFSTQASQLRPLSTTNVLLRNIPQRSSPPLWEKIVYQQHHSDSQSLMRLTNLWGAFLGGELGGGEGNEGKSEALARENI